MSASSKASLWLAADNSFWHERDARASMGKIAKVFDVDLSQLVKKPTISDDINISILEKVNLIDTLDKDEKEALLKMIDIAIAKKKMKDNLANLMQE